MESGPAIHAPPDVRAIVLQQAFRIEFLNISTPKQALYAKNHITSMVTFVEPFLVDGTHYLSARISMELGPVASLDSSNIGKVSSML